MLRPLQIASVAMLVVPALSLALATPGVAQDRIAGEQAVSAEAYASHPTGMETGIGLRPVNPATEREIRQAEEQMHRAYVDHDTALFASLYADDATFTYSRGEVVGKDERVRRFTAPFVGLQDVVQKIRVYDDIAIVNCLSTFPNAARTQVTAIQITRVWQKRNGRWQVVAFQSTPTKVPEDARADQSDRITFATR